MASEIPIFAWTFNDYMNTDPVGALGCHMFDIKAHHINDVSVRTWLTTYTYPLIPKFAGAYSAADTKTIVASWNTYFPGRVKYWLLPDEPPLNGITTTQITTMADAIREVSTIPIVLNLAANAAHAPYVAAAKATITMVDAYCNGDDACSWINSLRSYGEGVRGNAVLEASRWLKAQMTAAGMTRATGYSPGFVVQAFKQVRCAEQIAERSTVFGDELFKGYLDIFVEEFGTDLSLIGLYAWIADNDYDGKFPVTNSDLRPTIKKFCVDAQGRGFAPLYPVTTGTVAGGVSIAAFTSDKSQIAPGGSTMLRWQTNNATSLSIDQGIGTVTGTTSHAVSPAVTTIYKLTATGSDGKIATATVTITVGASAPTVPTLDNPAVFYTNTTRVMTFANLGSKSVTKVRVWFDPGNGQPYIANRGVITHTPGGSTFTYQSDDFVSANGMFYVEYDNDNQHGVTFTFKQVAPPRVSPTSGAGVAGQALVFTMNASAAETIAQVSASNASVATATKSGNTATVTLLGAGTATITIYPQVVAGFNNTDYAIQIPVTVTATTSAIAGSGTATLAANAVCDLEV